MKTEKAILVSIVDKNLKETKTSLNELKKLAESANIQVEDIVYQKRRYKDPAYFIGYGFAEKLAFRCRDEFIDVLIFDNELSYVQEKNLEELTGTKIISRSLVILDIFAKRARTHEGKLQIECAQLEYLYPRLLGKGHIMSRLGGGIGTRGPGETKLEQDRRKIRKRIKILKNEIEKVRKVRKLQRNKRKDIPLISLVGYTNAGKSTLLNSITKSDAYIEDKLFSTVDPLIRKYEINGNTLLFSDTVGFISKIPHQLIDAFHATLEEVIEADILLHVVDATDINIEKKINSVENTLNDIGALNKKIITVFNKCDLENSYHNILENKHRYFISAKSGKGIKNIIEDIQKIFFGDKILKKIKIPLNKTELLSFVYSNSKVINKHYTDTYTEIEIEVYKNKLEQIEKALI